MELGSWYGFVLISFFTIISPGPTVLLTISNGLKYNIRSVVISSLANALGLFFLSSASMLGLGVILQTSSILFVIMKILGASYLIYIGIKQFRSSVNIFDSNETDKIQKNSSIIFRKAFLVCITNPKPIIFFTAIFPIFLNTSNSLVSQFFIMTFTFTSLSFSILMGYAYFANYCKIWFSNKKRAKNFNRISGSIFIALGIVLLKLESKNG